MSAAKRFALPTRVAVDGHTTPSPLRHAQALSAHHIVTLEFHGTSNATTSAASMTASSQLLRSMNVAIVSCASRARYHGTQEYLHVISSRPNHTVKEQRHEQRITMSVLCARRLGMLKHRFLDLPRMHSTPFRMTDIPLCQMVYLKSSRIYQYTAISGHMWPQPSYGCGLADIRPARPSSAQDRPETSHASSRHGSARTYARV